MDQITELTDIEKIKHKRECDLVRYGTDGFRIFNSEDV